MNSKGIGPKERAHHERIKSMPCALCSAPPPSELHHIEQSLQHAVLPLCPDCHRGSRNGLHGGRAMWRVHKATEIGLLDRVIKELTSGPA